MGFIFFILLCNKVLDCVNAPDFCHYICFVLINKRYGASVG